MRRNKFSVFIVFLAGVVVSALAGVVGGTVGSFAATDYEDLSLFTSVLTHVRRHYVEPVEEKALLKGAVNGMLQQLDPHSSYLDNDAYEEMQVDTKGEFYGLGIEITKRRDGYIEVVSPIDGTPAAEVGIRARDQIVAICPTEVPDDWTEDCHSTKGMTLFKAVRLMRGEKGTEITIDIYRKGFNEPQPFTIVRDVVKVVSVSGRLLEPGYGYVRLRAFQERTIQDLEKALKKLHEEAGGPLDGLVIDMRDNPGGLLDQAVKVADLWLDDGLVVYTQGRVESQRQDFRAHREGTESSYPITILVNEGTASASEIVAGALQDQHRALVIGVKTFGKGSVQTVFPLEGGRALRLTTALYYTPAGRSIQEVGITPDIVVQAQAANGEADTAGPQRIREKDLEGHFTQEDANPDAGPSEGEPEAEGPADSDVQLARALEVLKSWTYFERLRKDPGATSLQARAPDTAP
jgi:carboxyl-terminal processing protease